jgi:hypothetical protein
MLQAKVTTAECAKMLEAKDKQIETLIERLLELNEETTKLKAALAQAETRADNTEINLQS